MLAHSQYHRVRTHIGPLNYVLQHHGRAYAVAKEAGIHCIAVSNSHLSVVESGAEHGAHALGNFSFDQWDR